MCWPTKHQKSSPPGPDLTTSPQDKPRVISDLAPPPPTMSAPAPSSHPNRIFDATTPYNFSPGMMETFMDPQNQFNHLPMAGTPRRRGKSGGFCCSPNEIFIAIAGVCEDGCGTFGVFFKENSPLNYSAACVSLYLAPTMLGMGLQACLVGLQEALKLKAGKFSGLTKIVFKTDCEEFFEMMTARVFRWKAAGFKDANVSNVFMLQVKNVEDSIEELKERGVEVLFWCVKAEHNKEANDIAKSVS